jgi:hypothetical protein
MAGKETDFVHAQWWVEMGNMIGAARDVLDPAVEHRHVRLVRVGSGTTQMRHSKDMITELRDLVVEGDSIRDRYDRRMQELGKAQAAAGGLNEVYGDKQAYQH